LSSEIENESNPEEDADVDRVAKQKKVSAVPENDEPFSRSVQVQEKARLKAIKQNILE
jgi:hypothetical protein